MVEEKKMSERAKVPAAGMAAVAKYFEMKLSDFRAQWAQLTDLDKTQLKEGIGSGSLTY